MTNNDLYKTLMNGYSMKNLNKISSTIIHAYHEKDFDFLFDLSRQFNGGTGNQKIGKIFSGLMMRYHPDRRAYWTDQIQQVYHAGQPDKLREYTKIFSILRRIEQRQNSHEIVQETSDSSEPSMEQGSEIYPEDGRITTQLHETHEKFINDFLSALSHKEYGNLDVSYNKIDLENTEGDLELSGYSITDLTGLEYCSNLTGLDLSHNKIYDLSPIVFLTLIEEIDLSFNRITHVNALAGMHFLKTLDISFNDIEDLTPLMDLNRLEYVNCIGNPITKHQIDFFRKKGVVIIFL